MAESLTLATPEVVPAITTTDYKVARLVLDPENALIIVALRGSNGELKEFRYDGPTATSLLVALNKANLAAKSLQRRILERLTADGLLVGAVSGVPD